MTKQPDLQDLATDLAELSVEEVAAPRRRRAVSLAPPLDEDDRDSFAAEHIQPDEMSAMEEAAAETIPINVELTRSIAELAAAAVGSAGLLQVLHRIEHDMAQADEALATLEGQRANLILDGRDVGEFHQEVFSAKQMKTSLQAAYATMKGRYGDAVGGEETQRLEAEAAKTREVSVAGYRSDMEQFLDAMQKVAAIATRIDEHRNAIENTNKRATRAGRADLMVNLARERRAIVVKVAGEPAAPELPERMDRESEEGYAIRLGNAQSVAAADFDRADPFRKAADKAMSAIDAIAIDMDPFARAKNRRLITTQRYRGYDGQAAIKTSDSVGDDGQVIGHAPNKIVLGPYGKHGERKIEPSDRGIIRGVGHDVA